MGIFRDITWRRQAEEELLRSRSDLSALFRVSSAISRTMDLEELFSLILDTVTGLANRRYMDIVLERSFARAKRLESQLSALMLDIDYFKKYNDAYGHAAGDSLLEKIAKVILKETMGIDLVVRYGGEEFLILLPETGLTLACEVAERIRKKVNAKMKITVSLGISSYHEGMKKNKDLIEKADKALYQAKQKGRNRIEAAE